MRIAVLGWGSLVWCPRELEISTKWRPGPALPIEFARKSRGNRVTLVLVPDYPHMNTVFWALSTHSDIDDACANLHAREGKPRLGDIHYTTGDGLSTYRDSNPDASSADVSRLVGRWLDLTPGLDAVIWTGLPPKGFTRFDPTGLATEVVDFLRSLSAEEQERAKDYVQFAPSTVRTPVRHALEQPPLGWLPEQLPEHLFADIGE